MVRFRAVIDFIRLHKASYAAGLCCMLLASWVQTLFPNLLGKTIDIMGTPGFDPRRIWHSIGLILLIALTTFVFTFLWRTLVIGNARKLECDLRARLFRQFLVLSPAFYHRHRTGDLMAHAISDIGAVRMAFGPATAMSVNSLVILIASIATMSATVDRRLTLLTLLPFPFVVWAMLSVGKRVRASFLAMQASFADLSGKVNEGIHGVRIIKAYVQEDATLADFRASSGNMVEASMAQVSASSMLGPVIEVCFSLSFALNLILGGRMVLDGAITVGAFVAFNTYLAMIIAPVLNIGRITNLFQRGIASMDRLNGVLLAEPEIQDASDARAFDMKGALSVEKLHFTYPGTGTPALSIDRLVVPAGSTLGLIGPTGCGKTTLANLLLRAWDTTDGALRIDGRPLRAHTLASLRDGIAFVSQEPFLFSATIGENITCFHEGRTEEEIRQAAADSCLLETIDAMPEGLGTLLGERGVNLSGGQKQRVAIARALLRDAPILILDDALSAVDTVTEARILEAIARRRRGKTTLVISHRISAVAATDRILVLDHGRVVQTGTHGQLLEEGGMYRAIFEDQEESRRRLIRG